MFKRLFFDLANPLAADFKPGADFLQRLRRFRQHPVTDDVSFPFGQPAQTFLQHPVFLRRFLFAGQGSFQILPLVDQHVDFFAFVFFVADGNVQRRIAAQTTVHFHHVFFVNHQLAGNLLNNGGFQLLVFVNAEFGLDAAEIVKQLFLRRYGADLDQRPRTQDKSLIAALIHQIA